MKPDAGRARDKERLADKKAKKATAKAARKAAQTVSPAELEVLEGHIKTRTGRNRRVAFTALAALDAERAVHVVEVLVRTAEGKTLQELGGLLLLGGDARTVDAAAQGRFGELRVCELASHLVDDAVDRLLLALPALSAEHALRRVASLGVVPLHEVTRSAPAIKALLAALLDDDRLDGAELSGRPQGKEFRAALGDALLEVDPAALWVRRDRCSAHQAAVAGLASRSLAETDAVAVGVVVAWLEGLPSSSRGAARRSRGRGCRDRRCACRWRCGCRCCARSSFTTTSPRSRRSPSRGSCCARARPRPSR